MQRSARLVPSGDILGYVIWPALLGDTDARDRGHEIFLPTCPPEPPTVPRLLPTTTTIAAVVGFPLVCG